MVQAISTTFEGGCTVLTKYEGVSQVQVTTDMEQKKPIFKDTSSQTRLSSIVSQPKIVVVVVLVVVVV